MVEDRRNDLLNTLDDTHRKYLERRERATIKGDWPDLHFHLRSLGAAAKSQCEEFAEYAYAMLVAWQMNSRGASMHEFDVFRSSLLQIWDKTEPLRGKTPDALNESDWADLKEVFKTIKCMESGVSLVGNSKVMAPLASEPYTTDGRALYPWICLWGGRCFQLGSRC